MKSAHTQAFRLIWAETIFHKNNTDYVLAKKKAAIDFTVRRGQT